MIKQSGRKQNCGNQTRKAKGNIRIRKRGKGTGRKIITRKKRKGTRTSRMGTPGGKQRGHEGYSEMC